MIHALHWWNDSNHFYVKTVNTSAQINAFMYQIWEIDIMLINNVCIYCLQQLNSFVKYIIIMIFNNQIVNNDICVNYLWKKQLNYYFLYKWLFFFHSIQLHFSLYVNIYMTFQMLALMILIIKLLKKLLSHLFFYMCVLTLIM